MTPSERERRIEAAARTIFGFASPTCWDTVAGSVRGEYRKRAAEVFDAADEAVPTVSREQHARVIMNVVQLEHARAERAEAAARDFAKALRGIEDHPWKSWRRITATRALNDHPSFSLDA